LSEECIDAESDDASLEMGEDWKAQIDEITGLPGMAEVLASSAVCWITARSGGRVIFANLGRHNGETAKTRARKAAQKAKERKSQGRQLMATNPRPEQSRAEEEASFPPPPPRGEAGVPWPANPAELVAYAGRAAQLNPNSATPRRPDEGFCYWWWDEQEKRGWRDPQTGREWHDWRAAFRSAWRATWHNQKQQSNPTLSHARNQRPAAGGGSRNEGTLNADAAHLYGAS
jgi:hypothetical protein